MNPLNLIVDRIEFINGGTHEDPYPVALIEGRLSDLTTKKSITIEGQEAEELSVLVENFIKETQSHIEESQ